MQYVQRREVKKERARGTWHLSSTCWEPRLCKGPLCQVGIAVATPSEGGRKWELLESNSFIATVFFCCFSFLLERQLFLALVSVFVFGGKGFESGVWILPNLRELFFLHAFFFLFVVLNKKVAIDQRERLEFITLIPWLLLGLEARSCWVAGCCHPLWDNDPLQ